MRLGVILLSLSIPLSAQTIQGGAQLGGGAVAGIPTGTLAITLVGSATATDTTIVQSFSSNLFTSSTMECTPTAGGSAVQSNSNNVTTGLNHQQGVGGLLPSTAYTCQAAVTNGSTVTATFTATTTATPSSTAITGLTLGSVTAYNSINGSNQGGADTFPNCKSSDGNIYMLNNDTVGFTISGVPAYVADGSGGGQQSIMKVLSESPLTIQTVNYFSAFGSYNPLHYLADGLSSKPSGLFCMGGNLFVAAGRQNQATTQSGGGFAQTVGNIFMSSDKGRTWNNPDNPGQFSTFPRSPLSASMFGTTPTQMGSASFVKYCADDGTQYGYTDPCSEHDNGNLWVYLLANEGTWTGGGTQGGGNSYYLARVARAKIGRLLGSDLSWWTGAADGGGNVDGDWTSTQTSAVAIMTITGHLGSADFEYIPAKNRYLLLTNYYTNGATNGGSRLDTVVLGFDCAHPWQCNSTPIYSHNFVGSGGGGTGGGAYGFVLLNDTKYTGTTPTVLWTGNFVNDYFMYFATLTIN